MILTARDRLEAILAVDMNLSKHIGIKTMKLVPPVYTTARSIRYLHQVFGCGIEDLIQDFRSDLFPDTDSEWEVNLRLNLLATIQYKLINLEYFKHHSQTFADFQDMRHTAYRYSRSWQNINQ